MKKPIQHQQIERSREQQAPKKGTRVLYPDPLPPRIWVKLGKNDDPLPQFKMPKDPAEAMNEEGTGIDFEDDPVYKKGHWHETAEPTGQEQWRPAKVKGVERRSFGPAMGPDEFLVLLEPEGDEAALSVPVSCLREDN